MVNEGEQWKKEELLRENVVEDEGDDYLSGLGNKGREKRYNAIYNFKKRFAWIRLNWLNVCHKYIRFIYIQMRYVRNCNIFDLRYLEKSFFFFFWKKPNKRVFTPGERGFRLFPSHILTFSHVYKKWSESLPNAYMYNTCTSTSTRVSSSGVYFWGERERET